MESSTIRSALDPTIGDAAVGRRPTALHQVICTEWQTSGQADLVSALRRHPNVLCDRSLLLNLAIEEYQANRQVQATIDLEQHCRRFEEFGSSIRRSILRQLEAQQYIDDHPELLDALGSFSWPRIGESFGDFQVLEELGSGATAHVYLCRQRDVGDRHVVVKASPYPSIEASILGRLNHPCIIPIFSTGFIEEYGMHYLCMPFCGRSTLSDLLDVAFHEGVPRRNTSVSVAANRWCAGEQPAAPRRNWQLPPRLACGTYNGSVLAIAVQIAEALEFAHRRRILHGDLKPSNVLLTPTGSPLLLDFNLSKDHSTSFLACGGTLPYMPPEHLRLVAEQEAAPERFEFDPASDIYSFGALVYELLCGAAPVWLPTQSEDVPEIAGALLTQVQQGPAPIRRRNPLVSRRLESLILQCLAFSPADRPLSMAEVVRRLRLETRAPAAIGRVARARPFLFSLTLGLPLVLISGAGAYYANQPPGYLSKYQQGLNAASAGELKLAVDYFAAAARENPNFVPARFDRARAWLALDEIDLALEDFHQLARSEQGGHSMAYVGYCFSLKLQPVAAIAWYERALQDNGPSVAICNNLGASYLEAQGKLTRREQLQHAEELLKRAMELDPTSAAVQLNVVRLSVAKAKRSPDYDPVVAWESARAVLEAAPNDLLVRSLVAEWLKLVLQHAASTAQLPRPSTGASSAAENSADQFLRKLQAELGPVQSASAKNAEIAKHAIAFGRTSPAQLYFIEPAGFKRADP